MQTEKARILGGNQFLEVAPADAHKGKAVAMLLARYPWEDGGLVYIGDDDKDEEAFEIINRLGGITIVVADESRISQAKYRLENPYHVRRWLSSLADHLF